ncbi:hypothetical protein HMPREF1632_07680 [Mageeibacillus indolicus 0009-5]|nr:hypothetical protein HMPREF1632_07680 [Mageeibacillus indolicus 0009-5]
MLVLGDTGRYWPALGVTWRYWAVLASRRLVAAPTVYLRPPVVRLQPAPTYSKRKTHKKMACPLLLGQATDVSFATTVSMF